MRYKVTFDHRDKRYMVVDSYRVNRPVCACGTLEDAQRKARWEEERWFKCTPDEDLDGWPKDLAAI